MSVNISRRTLASRRNARLGGLKTAQTHSPEFLEARASKAGQANRDKYGVGYYRHLALQPRTRQPKEVLRTTSQASKLPDSLELMNNAVTQALQ